MHRPFALLLALALTACGEAELPAAADVPAAAPAILAAAPVCHIEAASRLPLLGTASGKPLVQVAVNGQLLRMAVDTGAETSVLTPLGAATLGLATGTARREVRGLGGVARYGVVRLDHIDWGGQIVRNTEVPVLALSGEPDLDGLVGADLLRPYQVDLDFGRARLTLYRGPGCGNTMPVGWTSLPWRHTAHPLPIVPVTLDGRDLFAMLDTGTRYSAANRRSVGLDNADLAQDHAVTGFGAGNLALHGAVHRFASLSMGDIEVPHPVLRVVPLSPQLPADLLVGMDVLSGGRLWLDYPGRRAFLALPRRDD